MKASKTFKISVALGAMSLVMFASAIASAGEAKTLCVYDPSGAAGDIYQMSKDYQVAAAEWGVDFELKPYQSEKAASDDFKAGTCDAVLFTGLRARDYLDFAGTIEAIGALPEYDLLEDVIEIAAKEKAASLMQQDGYESAAIFPFGKVYLFVADRNTDHVSDLAGLKIATFDFDEAAKYMVEYIGASISAADITTFAGMFNNGSVDAAYAPATAFEPLELEKGLEDNGGIIRFPLANATLQVIVRTDEFPEGFGVSSRAYSRDQFDTALKTVKKAEDNIPSDYWIDISDDDQASYSEMFREVRIKLRDEGVYDGDMLKVLRRVRCSADGSAAECVEKLE